MFTPKLIALGVTVGHVTYQVVGMLSLYHTHPVCGASMYVTHPSMSAHSSHLQVTPPESVKQRYWHSITASRLGPGLPKVLVFGGRHKRFGDVIAETATLEFGMSYCISVVCRGVLIANGHQLKHSLCLFV